MLKNNKILLILPFVILEIDNLILSTLISFFPNSAY